MCPRFRRIVFNSNIKHSEVKGKMIKKQWLIPAFVVSVVIGLFCLGIRSCYHNFQVYDDFNEDDYIRLTYYHGGRGELLGSKTDNMFYNIYEVADMDSDEYLYVDQTYPTGGPSSTYLLMNADLDEPILCYDVSEIEIQGFDEHILKIQNQEIIKGIISLRKNGNFSVIEDIPQNVYKTTFRFMLPCDLVLECWSYKGLDERFHMVFWDLKNQLWKDYDVTEFLIELT